MSNDGESKTTNILLESGTNEVELLEFYLGGESFGVNVLKVKRIINLKAASITKQPCTDPAILGVINLQDTIIPIIDLAQFCIVEGDKNEEAKKIIITEFNRSIQGFIVDGVNKIHRISWNTFQSVSNKFRLDYITGVCIIEKRNVLVLDFEKVIGSLSGTQIFSDITPPLPKPTETEADRRGQVKLVCAEDSNMVRELLDEVLKEAGFGQVVIKPNGQELHQLIAGFEAQCKAEGKPITDFMSAVITDLEMPLLDGFTLCKEVKTRHPEIPVLVLSSLISDEIVQRCKSVQADEAVSKGELEKLIPALDRLLFKGQ